jgi:hypothetical protein
LLNNSYKKQFYEGYCQRKLTQAGILLIDPTTCRYKINDKAKKLNSLSDWSLLQQIKYLINLPNLVLQYHIYSFTIC